MSEDSGVSGRLAGFLAGARWEDVPTPVRHEAKRTVMNCVGTALGGCRDPAVEMALKALGPFFGPGDATVIGRTDKADALSAAFLNAVGANVLEFDDTHLPTVIHPGAPVVPPLFALAERRPVSGAALLHAVALGVEAECRIGNAVSPQHYRRGWHITSTCGVFGGAAAAGRLLGLDAERMLWALGNAAAQSAGLIESLGSMAKSVSVGNAAKNGLAAALLAEAGFTGPARPLEGPHGFARVMGEFDTAPDFAAITAGLGESWEILKNAYKPYPCGVVLFPVVDACLDLIDRHGLRAEQIARVVVRGNPLLLLRADRPEVSDGREAKVSIQHTVAAVFLHRAAGIAQYADACVADPAVLALRRKVVVEEDGSVPVEAAFVTVETGEGRSFIGHVEHARGTPGHPMSDGELEEKFRGLTAECGAGIDADRLIASIWALDREADAARLVGMMAPASAS